MNSLEKQGIEKELGKLIMKYELKGLDSYENFIKSLSKAISIGLDYECSYKSILDLYCKDQNYKWMDHVSGLDEIDNLSRCSIFINKNYGIDITFLSYKEEEIANFCIKNDDIFDFKIKNNLIFKYDIMTLIKITRTTLAEISAGYKGFMVDSLYGNVKEDIREYIITNTENDIEIIVKEDDLLCNFDRIDLQK